MSEVIAVIHAKAKNDICGNAQRLYIGLKSNSSFDWVNEGYKGFHAMPEEWRQLPLLVIDITQNQYDKIRKMNY
jgi:hypothetical protein